MATSATMVRPSAIPRFDTLSNELIYQGQHCDHQRREYSFASNVEDRPRGKDAILQGFARFIAALTGDEDVCFQFAIRNGQTTPDVFRSISAVVFGDSIDISQNSSNGEQYDFGLELLADLDNFDHADSLLLDCPFIVQYHVAQMSVVLHYDSSLVGDLFADSLFDVVINEISRSPVRNIQRIPNSQLSVLNHPPKPRTADLERPELLHAGFQRSAAQYSHRHAVHFKSAQSTDCIFTYRQLDSVSDALAVKLRGHIGTQRSQPIVPAFMMGSPAFYVSWLAVLKAGFAFCPLPMDAPPEQLREIVEEVGASVVLTDGAIIGGSPWDAWYCDDDELATCIDVAAFIKAHEPASDIPEQLPTASGTDLAYVMYTSGSTGRPKGVKIQHHAAASSIRSHSRFISKSMIKDGFRWFQFAAPTFDPSIMEIFTTWWTGGTLCAATRETLLTDPEAVINGLSATIMMATPSMASVLRPERLHLKHLWTMGEKLTPRIISNFSSDSPQNACPQSHTPSLKRPYRLLNFYGPTEASINCTVVPDFSASDRGSIIGRPLETCSIVVIDPSTRNPAAVPLGFSGELAIGGVQLSQGYLNRVDQTNTAFVSSATYGRLYRTGDRARIVKSRNGELLVEFLGRITTDQVKLSGRRVELGQIESVISSVSGVYDNVAVVHNLSSTEQGSEQIVACIVADQDVQEDYIYAGCEAAAEKALPLYMRPASYVFLDKMPRSRSGKTDRKACALIAQQKVKTIPREKLERSGVESSDQIGSVLELIADALYVVCDVSAGSIAPHTDLLSMGLDSLRSVRFLQAMRSKGITSLTVADALRSRTPTDLAKLCVDEEQTIHSTSKPGQEPTHDLEMLIAAFDEKHRDLCAVQLGVLSNDIEQVLPTTATQSGMIASFIRSMSSGRRKYINHSVYYQAPGHDDSRVEHAWFAALSAPKILRTVFTSVDDDLSPFGQCVLKTTAHCAAFEFKYYICADDTSTAWKSALHTAKSEAEAAMTLSRPPINLAVLRSGRRTAYLLSMFHGIFDGGSLDLIVRNVEDQYFLRSPTPTTEIDVAVRAHFNRAQQDGVAYWQSQFEGYEHNAMPCVSALKPDYQSALAEVTEVIANVTLDKIQHASKANLVSPLSILQAAWSSVLFAYTGSNDVSFGSVVSDRLDDELSSCMGPTFVVVPVRLKDSGAETKSIVEVLHALTSRNTEALPYHHIPLSSLTTAEGGLPYDTLLAFQAFDKPPSHALWESIEYPAMEHDFAVMVEIWPTEAGPLRLRATYTHKHLDQSAATAMLNQLDDILNYICDEPGRSFKTARSAVRNGLKSQIPAVCDQWSVDSDAKADMFLHQSFERYAATNPDKTALIFKHSMDGLQRDVKWSYRELHTLAIKFACRLLNEFGSVYNEPIMICMEKCPELYVAILGILLAGAGWCPIDPYSPPLRQRAIMERTGSRILVATSTAAPMEPTAVCDGVALTLLDLKNLQSDRSTQAARSLPKLSDSSHLAYLIFTSGTTGLPKGVPIKHFSAAAATRALAETISSDVTGGAVRCMQFSQFTFDVFVQDMFYTFALGGTVISSTRQIMLQSFADLANETKATHAHLTPAFAATLNRSSIRTLEVVTMIGEKLSETVAEDWSTNMRAYNTYGPAEATVVSTVRQFTGKSDLLPSSNIGVPLSTVGTYVMDGDTVVMRGAIGELALAGCQLSPGYFNLPDVNAQKFIWNEELQQTLYMTGDLVRHHAGGTINFLGRNDDLVKLGGQRVELGEIAFALKDADSRIGNIEVLLCKRATEEKRHVVAFISCPALAKPSKTIFAMLDHAAQNLAHATQEYARLVLPQYMQPSTFVVVNQTPQTASAKVDRAALTKIYQSLDLDLWEQGSGEDTRPARGGEDSWFRQYKDVLSIIAGTLGVSPDSLRANSALSSLGIDSIAAIRLVPKINKLGCNISVIDVFQCKTVSDICHLTSVDKTTENGDKEQDTDLQSFEMQYYKQVADYLSIDDFSVIPTTVLQESLLSETLKMPEAYWSSHLFKLEDGVDLSCLKGSWIKVARREEALRAGFVARAAIRSATHSETDKEHGFLQIIYDEPEVDWSERTITSDLPGTVKNRLSQVAQHHHNALFRSPPWAVDILHHETSSVMLITIHHSIYDGSSLEKLEADLVTLYNRNSRPAQRYPWREVVARRSTINADSEATVEFWKASLHDFVPVAGKEEESLTDQECTKIQHRILYSRSSVSFTRLRNAIVEQNISSIVAILRMAWGTVLAELLETPQVLFAEVLSDRIMESKLETTIGPLLSIVPSLYTPKATISETLQWQDRFAKQAWTHRNVRPDTIKTLLGRRSGSQIYPAMFAFHPPSDDAAIPVDRLWSRLDDATNIQVEHPLAFNILQDSADCPRFELAVAESLMSEEEQSLLLRQIDALIEAIVERPSLHKSSITREMPVQLISKTTPRSDTLCPDPRSPVHWVQYWASCQPDWKAVEIADNIIPEGAETVHWSYAELLAHSNRVARSILSRGVSQRRVGMCLGRTLMSFAVILGVMISGNTYLPIDEAFPAERKAFLLADSNTAMIFSTKELFDGVVMQSDCELIDVDTACFEDELAATDSSEMPRQGTSRDDAYLLYTSGSTGKPKGVLVSQGNLASFVQAQSEFICDSVPATRKLGGKGKYLGLASRAFDVHIGEMFLAWRHGLAIVTGLRSMILDDLGAALSSLRISHASFVPSLLDQTGLEPEDAPELVFLGVGGEKMSLQTKKKWGSHDRVKLINAYGPTEATIGCCSGLLSLNSDMRDIGMPLGDSVGHVLVPGTTEYALRGQPGELCFTGSLIANGYLERPDAKGFVDDFQGHRMYRTGDIVKLTIDDHIHFLGRKDDQVKIRGQRVELGEVAEGVRLASESPVDVAALVIKHPELSRIQLIAFVAQTQRSPHRTQDPPQVLKQRLQDMNTSLRTKCQSSLPAYMVPDIIVPLDFIPLAATSGKSDSKVLIQVFSSVPISELMLRGTSKTHPSATPIRALSKSEQQVWNLICSVVRDIPTVISPNTTVFELGIDSLAAISVFSKLRAAGFNCSVSMVMRNPSIEQLAQTPESPTDHASDIVKLAGIREDLQTTQDKFLQSADCIIDPERIASVLPCLPLQEALIGAAMHDGSYGAYINHVRFTVGADVDIERLLDAWRSLVRDNEILRTCFAEHNDSYVQVVLKPDAHVLDWTTVTVDLSNSKAGIEKTAAMDIIQTLATEPPMRLTLLPSTESVELLLSISHAIYDGDSLGMMFDDLKSYYDGRSPSTRPSVRPLVEHITYLSKDQAREHWTSLLEGWETCSLLCDTPVRDVELHTTKRHFRAKLSSLEKEALSRKVTIATLLQAAFAITLASTLHRNDLIFGNVLSGRTISVDEADRILGPCVTTIPQRIKWDDPQATVADMLRSLQEANSLSLDFQHTSPRDIQRWLKADRPLYDVLFSFFRTGLMDSDPPLLRQRSSNIAVDYPLAVEFEANAENDELLLSIGFTDDFGTAKDAELFLEKLEMLTETMLERSDIAVQALGVNVPTAGHSGASSTRQRYDESHWTSLESQVRSLISNFTAIPEQEIHKNTAFIHLGVDSISAIRLARRFREVGIKVSSADVVRHNRLGALCNHLQASSGFMVPSSTCASVEQSMTAQRALLATLSAGGIDDLPETVKCYECTPLQSGMLAQSLATDGALYMHHHAIVCNAGIDIDRLKHAWDTVVQDLDVLRTTFHWVPKHTTPWVAVVHPDKRPFWTTVTVPDAREYWLRLSDDPDFNSRIQHTDPLASVHLVMSNDISPVLILSLHHAIYDGISLGMIFRQLSMRYHDVPTPRLTPFYDAAEIITHSANDAVDFWAKQIRGYEGAARIQQNEDPTLHERIVTADGPALEARCRMLDLDVKDVAIAAFGKAMMKSFGRRDVVFGQVVAARLSQLGDGDVVGPVFNTVPFRITLNDLFSTNRGMVDGVRVMNQDSVELQHAPLSEVQRRWRASASNHEMALIDSIFVYSKLDTSGNYGRETLGEPLQAGKTTVPSEYRLNFEVEHTTARITARALSSASSRDIDALLEDFTASMLDILDHPDRFAAAHPEGLRDLPLALQHPTTLEKTAASFDEAAVTQFADTIRKAMAEVAEVAPDSIALDSSIYSFGVDSIAAIQIVARCRKIGIRISVAQILSGGTLGRICEIVASTDVASSKKVTISSNQSALVSLEHQKSALACLNISRDVVEEFLPCLPGQMYHLMSWLQSGRTLYEPGWIYKAHEIEVDQLKSAWSKLRARHPVLRTTFASVEAREAIQVVMKSSAIEDDAFEVHHVQSSLLSAVGERAHLETREPSDMFSLPIRLRLIQAEDGDAIMLYCHHALYDAWTMPKLVKELASLYLGVEEVADVPAFSDFVRYTKQSISQEDEMIFWKNTLAGCEAANIRPSDTAARDGLDRRQIFCMAESQSIDVADLETLCNKQHISPHHIIILAFARALAIETDTTSPLFGFFQLGRSAAFEGIEEIMGPCVNTLPLGLSAPLSLNSVESCRKIQTLLAARVLYEQSNLRTAVNAFDKDATQLPFNSFINVLWNTKSLVGDVNEGDLFQPVAIGVPTDYTSPRAMVGRTAIDGLDTSLLRDQCLFMDVGRRDDQIVFGVRADVSLMDEERVQMFILSVEEQIAVCMRPLRDK